MLRLFHQESHEDMTIYAIKGNSTAKKNVFKMIGTSKELAAVFRDSLVEVGTRDLFAAEFALPLKQILGHMEHNGGMAADNVMAGAPIRTQTAGLTHKQR